MLTKPKTLLSKISKKIEFGSCNADNSKIRRFVKLIWEQHHQSTFVTMVEYVIQNCLSFAADKEDTEFLTI